MSMFREWSETLTEGECKKLAEYRKPLRDSDLHTQAAWLVYSFWQMFVHHAMESGAMHDDDGNPREGDAHRLGSLCATLDLEMNRILRGYGSGMPDDDSKLGYMSGYFASIVTRTMKGDEAETVKATWPVLIGAVSGKHTIVVPIVRDEEGNVSAMVAEAFGREVDAGDLVKAFAPKLAPGHRILAMLELGRYVMASDGEQTECFGANVVSVSGDLASLYLPLNGEDGGKLIERVEAMKWRLDSGQSGEAKCMGMGPIEECMMGYAQMLLQVDAPASDQGNEFDISNRGGIDPSLN